MISPLNSDWKTVKFGDVVKNANLTERDPESAGIERIVGLDHLDPGNLHVRRWNTLEDGTSFSRKFVPGQTLFGKRRAYQRKVAFAEFDGICSGDILTFEPKDPDVLLPELLPFICQTDAFFDHALGTSAGSLSPRTSWKALQDFEFPLPPIEEQKRIAEILWATDEALECFKKANADLIEARRIMALDFFSDVSGKDILFSSLTSKSLPGLDGWMICSGQDLLDWGYLEAIQDGNHGGQYPRSDEFATEGVEFLAANNISDDGKIDFENCPRLSLKRAERLRIKPAKGEDVILTHNATVGRVALIPDDHDEVVVSTSTTYYRINNSIVDKSYFVGFLRSPLFQRQLDRVMKQSTRNQVPINAQKKLIFVIPPRNQQQAFVEQSALLQEKEMALERHLAVLSALARNIRNAQLSDSHV